MYNRVVLMGRLGRDPDVRTVGDNGRKVALLRMATNRFYYNEGERQEITDWHSVVCWGRLAEICEQYLSTGRLIHIEGYLQTRSFEDRDGIRRWVTEVVANNLVMVNASTNETQQPNREKAKRDLDPGQDFSADFDDLPDDL